MDFVPGRPGIEEFVPGFLILHLTRDKGTQGQPRDIPSVGNPNIYLALVRRKLEKGFRPSVAYVKITVGFYCLGIRKKNSSKI